MEKNKNANIFVHIGYTFLPWGERGHCNYYLWDIDLIPAIAILPELEALLHIL